VFISSDDETLVRDLIYHFDRVRDEMQQWREEATTYIKAYNSFVDEENYPLQFKLFIPISASLIDTELPKFANGLLYRDPLMQVHKLHPTTSDEAILNGRKLVNAWMTDKRTILDLLMGIKEAKILGTSCFKIYHNIVKQVVKRYEPISVGGIRIAYNKIIEPMTVENRSRIRHCDMFNVYPDLTVTHEEEMEFVCHAEIKGLEELRHGAIEYENIDELEELGDYHHTDVFNHMTRLYNMDSARYQLPQSEYLYPKQPRLVSEFVVREWTRKGLKFWLISIGNREVLLRKQLIRYWPYKFIRNNPDPHIFLGRSELQQMLSLQFGYNDLVNMSLDNMLMALTKMFIVGDAAGLDVDTVQVEPSGVIHVDDISQIKVESWADINPSVLRMEQILMQGIERATGQSDYSRGATPQRKEFATTVLAIQQAADIKIDASIKHYERTAISPIAKGMIECAQEYLYEPTYIPTEQGNFDEIDLYGIQGLMDFKLNAAAMGISELRRSQLHDFTQDAAQLFGPQMPGILRLQILKSIADTYDGLEEIVGATNELIQQLQVLQATGAGQQQSVGGNLPPGNPQAVSSGAGLDLLSGAPNGASNKIGTGIGGLGGLESLFSVV